MVSKISSFIDRVERSSNPSDRLTHIWLSQASLDWLLIQHGFFKMSYHDSTTNKWCALQGLVKTGSELFEIGAPVLGTFYNTYGSTGTFILNRRIGQLSGDDYFMVITDELDPPIFWPLVIHELAHCWLSSQTIVEEISSKVHYNNESSIIERRVEEALCDAIATSFMGPSYVYSYINRLWHSFMMMDSFEYPKNSFRLEVMIRTLEQANYDEVEDLKIIIEETSTVDWEDEAIVDSLAPIEEFAKQLPFITKPNSLVTDIESVNEFVNAPPANLQKLFHVGWMLLNTSDMKTYSDEFNSINSTIQESLERNYATFNTQT